MANGEILKLRQPGAGHGDEEPIVITNGLIEQGTSGRRLLGDLIGEGGHLTSHPVVLWIVGVPAECPVDAG